MRSARIKQWIVTHHLTQQVVTNRIGYRRSSVSRALACEHVSGGFLARFLDAFPEAVIELLSDQQDKSAPAGKAKGR